MQLTASTFSPGQAHCAAHSSPAPISHIHTQDTLTHHTYKYRHAHTHITHQRTQTNITHHTPHTTSLSVGESPPCGLVTNILFEAVSNTGKRCLSLSLSLSSLLSLLSLSLYRGKSLLFLSLLSLSGEISPKTEQS
jgi:hypothetical protein